MLQQLLEQCRQTHILHARGHRLQFWKSHLHVQFSQFSFSISSLILRLDFIHIDYQRLDLDFDCWSTSSPSYYHLLCLSKEVDVWYSLGSPLLVHLEFLPHFLLPFFQFPTLFLFATRDGLFPEFGSCGTGVQGNFGWMFLVTAEVPSAICQSQLHLGRHHLPQIHRPPILHSHPGAQHFLCIVELHFSSKYSLESKYHYCIWPPAHRFPWHYFITAKICKSHFCSFSFTHSTENWFSNSYRRHWLPLVTVHWIHQVSKTYFGWLCWWSPNLYHLLSSLKFPQRLRSGVVSCQPHLSYGSSQQSPFPPLLSQYSSWHLPLSFGFLCIPPHMSLEQTFAFCICHSWNWRLLSSAAENLSKAVSALPCLRRRRLLVNSDYELCFGPEQFMLPVGQHGPRICCFWSPDSLILLHLLI